LPYGLPQDKANNLLHQLKADYLIAEAGSLSLESLKATNKTIKNIIWVAKAGSEHMDWSHGAPTGFSVNSWHDLVETAKASTSSEVLPLDKDSQVPPVSVFTPTASGSFDLVKYASDNLISGTAALLATLPRTYKLSSSDIVLPTTSFTDSYALCWAFAALHSHATLALNSVAGDKVDLRSATAMIKPTVLIASPHSVTTYLGDVNTKKPSGIAKYTAKKALQAGYLPSSAKSHHTDTSLSNLRVLLIPQSATTSTKPTSTLTSSDLHNLRLQFGGRIGYALTTPWVAGAITQTNIFDYRDKGKNVVNVGPPLTSVEIYLEGEEETMDSHVPRGKVCNLCGTWWWSVY
jgi:hypothetical protein